MPEFAVHPRSLRTPPYPRPVQGSPCAGRGSPMSVGIDPARGLLRSGHGPSLTWRPLLHAAPCPEPAPVRRQRDKSQPPTGSEYGPMPAPMRPRFCCIRCGRCRLGRGGCHPPETTRRICGLRIQCRARSPCQTPGAEMRYFPALAAPAYKIRRCAPRCGVRCRPCRAPDQ